MPNLQRLHIDKTPISGTIDTVVVEQHANIKHIFLTDTYVTKSNIQSSKIEYIPVKHNDNVDIVDSVDTIKVYLCYNEGRLLNRLRESMQSNNHIRLLELRNTVQDIVREEISKSIDRRLIKRIERLERALIDFDID